MESVYEIADVHRLTPENARIEQKGDFLVLFMKKEAGEECMGQIIVRLAFPFESKEEYLILTDEEGKDLGIIEKLSERSEEEQKALRREVEMRYFMPVIRSIDSIVEKYGSSVWKVRTDAGVFDFSVRDTYKSLIHLGKRMIVTDGDGNRYEIPDVTALSRKDRKKLELYIW